MWGEGRLVVYDQAESVCLLTLSLWVSFESSIGHRSRFFSQTNESAPLYNADKPQLSW